MVEILEERVYPRLSTLNVKFERLQHGAMELIPSWKHGTPWPSVRPAVLGARKTEELPKIRYSKAELQQALSSLFFASLTTPTSVNLWMIHHMPSMVSLTGCYRSDCASEVCPLPCLTSFLCRRRRGPARASAP
jgi:hypothetical protein